MTNILQAIQISLPSKCKALVTEYARRRMFPINISPDWFLNQNGGNFNYQGCLPVSGDIFSCVMNGMGMLLVPNRQSPGMVLKSQNAQMKKLSSGNSSEVGNLLQTQNLDLFDLSGFLSWIVYATSYNSSFENILKLNVCVGKNLALQILSFLFYLKKPLPIC